MKKIYQKTLWAVIASFFFLMSHSTLAQSGKALAYDGINDHAIGPNFSQLTDNITLEARVYWDGDNADNQIIIYNGNSSLNGYGIFINVSNGNRLAGLCGGISVMNTSLVLPTNQWSHVALVRKSGSWAMYVNGVSEYLDANWAVPNTPSGTFSVGSDGAGSGVFNGKIDDARFWSAAVCQASIIQYRNCELSGTESNLLAYYDFNQGLADMDNTSFNYLMDRTSNFNHLLLGGFGLTGTTSNFVAPTGVLSNACGVVTVPAPVITTSGSTNICSNTNVILTSSVGDSYLWSNGATTQQIVVSSAGDYHVTVNNPYGCPGSGVSEDTTVTVKNTSTGDTSATVLGSYTWYGNSYTSSGDYTHTLTNAVGCDSVVTLHLTVGPNALAIAQTSIWDTWPAGLNTGLSGQSFTSLGNADLAHFSFSSHLNDDGASRLHIVPGQSLDTTLSIYARDVYVTADMTTFTFARGEVPLQKDMVYTLVLTNLSYTRVSGSNPYAGGSGTYFGSFQANVDWLFSASQYCDMESAPTVIANHITQCSNAILDSLQLSGDNIVWYDSFDDNTPLNVATYLVKDSTYYATQATMAGCLPSGRGTIAANTYMPSDTGATINHTANDSYTWQGTDYAASGTYYHTTTNSHGCDSTLRLDLTIISSSVIVGSNLVEPFPNFYGGPVGNQSIAGQSFKALADADLAEFRFKSNLTNDGSSTLYVIPGESLDYNSAIYSRSVSTSFPWTTLSFNRGEVPLQKGQIYTVALTNLEYTLFSNTNPYPDGRSSRYGSFDSNNDWAFAVKQYCDLTAPADPVVSSNMLTSCVNATLAHIDVTGTYIKWYDEPSSFASLSLNTVLKEDSTYYVTQSKLPGCLESNRVSVLADQLLPAPDTSVTTVTACGSYLWQNEWYFSTDTVFKTLSSYLGCDSIVSLRLTINPIRYQNDYISLCKGDSVFFQGVYYKTSGEYYDTLTTTLGCDSILSMEVNVFNPDDPLYLDGSGIVTDEYADSYQWIDCNNGGAVLPGEANYNFYPSQSGNYAVIYYYNSCIDTSDCFSIDLSGVNSSYHLAGVSIYPNPTSGIIMVSAAEVPDVICLKNTLGQTVLEVEPEGLQTTLNVSDFRSGVYWLETRKGDKRSIDKLIIQE